MLLADVILLRGALFQPRAVAASSQGDVMAQPGAALQLSSGGCCQGSQELPFTGSTYMWFLSLD